MKGQAELNEFLRQVPGWQEVVRRQVDSLHFGVVQIVIHDSRVTQIDKTERFRLDGVPPKNFLADWNTGDKNENEQTTDRMT